MYNIRATRAFANNAVPTSNKCSSIRSMLLISMSIMMMVISNDLSGQLEDAQDLGMRGPMNYNQTGRLRPPLVLVDKPKPSKKGIVK